MPYQNSLSSSSGRFRTLASALSLTLLSWAPSTPAQVAGINPAHPFALVAGCPFVVRDSEANNSGYLDSQALYAVGQIPIIPAAGSSIRIEGDFPRVRYFSVQSYDGASGGNLVDSLSDALIVPTGGGALQTNPARLPESGGYTFKYSFRIRYAAPPANAAGREPNTLYVGEPSTGTSPTRSAKVLIYRIYLTNRNADALGDRPLPTIYYSGPNGEISLDQTPDRERCARFASEGDLLTSVGGGVPSRDIRFVPVTGTRTGVAYGNSDINFLRAYSSRLYGRILVVRTKRFVTPALQRDPSAEPQVRYWSLCHYELYSTAVLSCLADREIVTQRDDQQVFVLSLAADRPAAATADRGYNWIEWGAKSAELIGIRQLLADPGFAGNYVNAINSPNAPLTRTLGEYAPDISYCDAATFSAYAASGATALLDACHAASAQRP